MADAIPPIKVSIVADTSGLKAGVDQATKGIKDIEDNVKTASSGMSNFVGKIKQVGATLGVAFAGTQIIQFGKDVIMASSNMAESLSKVQVVFGENAGAVEKWGNTSATAMGISKQAALEAAGTYGNLFQAFGLGQGEATKMSTSLVQLASDMASFNNTSIDDAILALRSGLSGETEPLKRFGVALNEVRLKQEALDLGLIKSTKEALTPAAKAQAAYALILHDTKLAQGDYARTADGTANTMRTLAAQMQDAKVALGDALMPAFRGLLAILKVTIPILKAIGEFFKNNQDEVKAFAITIGVLTAAYGAYMLITNAATIAQKALNLALAVNPFVAIAIGVGLLVAILVKAYKNVEGFRNAVNIAAKFALTAFASIIPIVGRVGEAIAKVVLGPLKTLLTALSHLPGVGKYAKTALDFMNKGIEGISDFADAASKKAKELAANLDKTASAADKAAKKTKDATKTTTTETTKKGGLTEEQKSKLDKYIKQAKDIQKDIQEAIDDANDKALEALNDRNEKMAEANKKYLEREAELNKNYKEAMAAAQKRYDETAAAELKKKNEAETAALKKLDERKAEIEKSYLEKTASLTKDYTEKVAEIRTSAEEKSINLTKAAAEKRQSIIQQSIDRLRTAFASKVAFDIGDTLAGGGGVTSLLDKLKKQLTGAKSLQQNAAALAGKGYTQTFIEQIVKQGPEMGNKIAEELLNASEESTKEMQALYVNLEDITNHGMDTLAKSMNAGGKLATEELMESFNQVGKDLAESLTVVNKDMNESLAKALKDYNEKTADAEKLRKEALAEANKDYQETMAEIQKNYTEAMAEALKTLTEARLEAQKTLDEGLKEAQKDLQEALIEAQKDYEKAIDAINKATLEKIEELKAKLAEVIALIAAISAAQAQAIAMQTPVYTPVVPTTPVTPTTPTTPTTTVNNNTTVLASTNANPQAIADSVQYAMQYGQVIQIAPGTVTTGLSAAQQGMNTVFQ